MILVKRCRMIVAGCIQRNVNPVRMFTYVTVIMVLLYVFAYFIFHQLSTPSHQPQQLKPMRRDGTDTQVDVSTPGTVSSSALATSKSLPLVCDEECRRFRLLLDAWPADDKPKAAVILLMHGPSSIGTFARSSRLFSANFNDAYGYPVIVFHEQNLNSDAYRQRLRSVTNSSLYFQVPRIA